MLVADNLYVKIRYTYTHYFHMFFKSSVGFVLSNCLNGKKKNTFGMRKTKCSIEFSVHKQPSVFNTTYTKQNRGNCPNVSGFDLLRADFCKFYKRCNRNLLELNIKKV